MRVRCTLCAGTQCARLSNGSNGRAPCATPTAATPCLDDPPCWNELLRARPGRNCISRYRGGLSEHPGHRQSENTHLASRRTSESQGEADNGRGRPSTLRFKKRHMMAAWQLAAFSECRSPRGGVPQPASSHYIPGSCRSHSPMMRNSLSSRS